MEENLVVAVDLGSTYIKGIIGSRTPDGEISINAVHTQISSGIEHGMIVDISALRNVFFPFMRELLNKAGLAKVIVKKFYVFYSYRKMKSVTVDVERVFEERVIDEELLDEMLKESYKNPTSNSYINIYSTPQAYVLNKTKPVLSPIGESATSIKGRYTLVVGNSLGRDNMEKAFNVGNVNVAENAYSCDIPLDSIGEVVLREQERKKGTLLIDFGGETTTISFYSHLSLRNFVVFEFGGRNVTNKLMEEFSILEADAEKLKIKCGVKPRQGRIAVNGGKSVLDLEKVSDCINREIESQLSAISIFCQESNFFLKIQTVVIVGGGAKCVGIAEKLNGVFGKQVVGGFPICLNKDWSCVDTKERLKYLDYSKMLAVLKNGDAPCVEPIKEQKSKGGKSIFSKMGEAIDRTTDFFFSLENSK